MARYGTYYPDALERFLATHLRAAQEAGDVDPGRDAATEAGYGNQSWKLTAV